MVPHVLTCFDVLDPTLINLLVSCDLAADLFELVSQERFGLDTRLLK
jgi:hypothetical protein